MTPDSGFYLLAICAGGWFLMVALAGIWEWLERPEPDLDKALEDRRRQEARFRARQAGRYIGKGW